MKDKETDQARALALAPRPPDMPVRVDTAMKCQAAEYEGPESLASWWEAAHHSKDGTYPMRRTLERRMDRQAS